MYIEKIMSQVMSVFIDGMGKLRVG